MKNNNKTTNVRDCPRCKIKFKPWGRKTQKYCGKDCYTKAKAKREYQRRTFLHPHDNPKSILYIPDDEIKIPEKYLRRGSLKNLRNNSYFEDFSTETFI